MTNNSLILSKNLDRTIAELISAISAASTQCGVEFVVIGATARDVILHYVYQIDIRRLTQDVDLAVIIEDWGKFDELKNVLLESGSFSETRIQHRLKFHDTIPLDIIPFGEIAKGGKIHWPPHGAVQMNIVGHQETFDNAMLIKIDKSTDPVRFASLPNLTALKIFAWKDRGVTDPKDATDIRIILDDYIAAGNRERLYDEHLDIIEFVDFDEDLAGALLLGYDIKSNINEPTRIELFKILDRETDKKSALRLASNMLKGSDLDGAEMESILKKLRLIKRGIDKP